MSAPQISREARFFLFFCMQCVLILCFKVIYQHLECDFDLICYFFLKSQFTFRNFSLLFGIPVFFEEFRFTFWDFSLLFFCILLLFFSLLFWNSSLLLGYLFEISVYFVGISVHLFEISVYFFGFQSVYFFGISLSFEISVYLFGNPNSIIY